MKLFLSLASYLLAASSLFSAERVALLIGCSNYADLHELTTPVNDANDLKTTLESSALGFECLPVVADATLEKFYEALDSFQAKAKDARVALIFYSGHGIEHDGVNYLIPVNAELNTATQLKTQALNVSAVMEALGKTKATAKLAILDCCRDNPFRVTKSWAATKSVRDDVLKELGEADIPQSTLVCFATSAGRKAAAVLDEDSKNSPFTQFLLKEIQTPGLSIRDVFERVHDTLAAATNGRQVPAVKTDNALSPVFRQTVLVQGTAAVKLAVDREPPITPEPRAKKGALVKAYLRTGGADASSPPGERMPPSDTRVSIARSFDGPAHANAAGYSTNEPVTLVFTGFLNIETAGDREFLLGADPSSGGFFHVGGVAVVNGHSLSASGERSVRLPLQPGPLKIEIRAWNRDSRNPNFAPPVLRMKETGKDPTDITPADLCHPDR